MLKACCDNLVYIANQTLVIYKILYSCFKQTKKEKKRKFLTSDSIVKTRKRQEWKHVKDLEEDQKE